MLFFLEGRFGERTISSGRPPVDVGAPPEVDVWIGEVLAAEASEDDAPLVTVRLTPLHADPIVQRFDAQVLRRRLRLSDGEPWRLELRGGSQGEVQAEDALTVRGIDGGMLVQLDAGQDPLLAGLFASDASVVVEQARQVVLWGSVPKGELRLDGLTGSDGAVVVPLEPAQVSAEELDRGVSMLERALGSNDDVAAAPSELELARERIAALESEVEQLDRALTRSQDLRIERERAYVDFQRSLAGIQDPVSLEAQVRALMGLPPESPTTPETSEGDTVAAEAEDPAVIAAREASAARVRSLNVLLRSEGVWSLDLLEAGELQRVVDSDSEEVDSPGGVEERRVVGTGPVVFRQLDDRGRLAGGIAADSMRLVGSRSGRSLAIVLTDGAFLEGGQRLPFSGGEHRIELRHVDPEPFMDALPELFMPEDLERRVDDGTWSVPLLQTELNALLESEIHGERYRVAWLGGVVDGVLRDVQLEVRDEAGRTERRIFADALRLVLDGTSLELHLNNGSTIRGDEKAPFLDGRMRIVVPRVSVERWTAADLPLATTNLVER